jgi:glycosyltransferase involved in cell wall biosynthesis
MKVLFLAPHPFYQERGTPIAVNMVLKVLSERGESVDLVTYHEGADVHYPGVRIFRIPAISLLSGIRPGFSFKKVLCDLLMCFKVLLLVIRRRYQWVHAVEESVFIALVLKWVFRIPYVYDMDSSLSQQMIEKYPRLGFLYRFLRFCEGIAVKNAAIVVPVCDSLSNEIAGFGPAKVTVLHDPPVPSREADDPVSDLKKEKGIDRLLALYVGNLESYQGIDLLLEAFALVLKEIDEVDLAVIGGTDSDIRKYRDMAGRLGIAAKVHFFGPKPVAQLAGYLSQADILLSPRIKGKNTPMKLYSYLKSGKVVLATDLPTHTQVLDGGVAMVAPPSPKEFAMGLLSLVGNADLRMKLGDAGKKLVDEKYSESVFHQKLNGIYDWLGTAAGVKI